MKDTVQTIPPFPSRELVYRRRPGWAEAVVVVELERRHDGPYLLIDQGGREVAMPATANVLRDMARAVANISAWALQHGQAEIGPVGRQLLERLGGFPMPPAVASQPSSIRA